MSLTTGQIEDTPVGTVVYVLEDNAILRIAMDVDDPVLWLHAHFPEAVPDSVRTGGLRSALEHYFGTGDSSPFSGFPVSFHQAGSRFVREVYFALREVPSGTTVSYGRLAVLAGYPGAGRAVGRAMAMNDIPIVIPCHRVIRSDGRIGGFSGGLHLKRALLQLEGITGCRD